MRASPSARPSFAPPQPGFNALGRLLLVGVASGTLIGAAVGIVLVLVDGVDDYGDLYVFAGALCGGVLGVVVNAVSATVLLLVVPAGARAREISVPAGRALLLPPPVLAAGALTGRLLSWASVGASSVVAGTAVSMALAVVAVVATAGWALAPMVCEGRVSRRTGDLVDRRSRGVDGPGRS